MYLKMMRALCAVFAILFASFLGACVTAEQKDETKWEVKATTASQQKIWVTKSDGSRQCAGRKGALSPAAAAQQLKQAGVMVFQSRAGSDGQMHAQKCGAPSGATVEVEISRIDLRKALGLGFVSRDTTAQ